MAGSGDQATSKRNHPDPELLASLAGNGSIAMVPARRLGTTGGHPNTEAVACEAPVELRLNGRSHTILMASPFLLEELALGHALSEGVVQRAEQIEGLTTGQADLPMVGTAYWVDIAVGPDLARRAKVRRLAPAATSCALCGLESLKELPSGLVPLADSTWRVEVERIFALKRCMEAAQAVFSQTGGTHAAALGTPDGRLLAAAEDIGRHNALDKAAGLALRGPGGLDPGNTMAFLSGRLSYEMALKVARLGIPLVASVSAPTALCVKLLDHLNVTVVAFCRPPRATVFTHPSRVAEAD